MALTNSKWLTLPFQSKTPPFLRSTGEVLPGSIAEVSYLRLGGFDQWVMIRGESTDAPILITLHGGPGFPEMRLFRHFNAQLEKGFTVVYWIQRGTDKSFSNKIPESSMTVEQFISDLDELVEILRKRFGQDKVVLYGHSWGSVLGVLYSKRFPQKVAAYVGTGQIGSWPESDRLSYEYVLAEAKRRKNKKALKQLRSIGPPPHTYAKMMVKGKWLARFFGFLRGMPTWKFVRIVISRPESSIFDLPNIVRGQLFSARVMWNEVSAINLLKAAPVLKVPVFFFLGRYDPMVASSTSVDYFNMLDAPFKRVLWFEESAHEPSSEEPERFNEAMMRLVRPIAIQELQNKRAA